MSVKELPVTHFKVAVEELLHRYKVCLALSTFIDEVSEAGSTTGKALSKIGAQNFLSGQSQWLPTCNVALESIFKMTTSANGKQLVGFSSNISQNISKTFPEQVKASKRRVLALSTKIATQVDEYKKAKLQHSKNLEKYQKMVTDTEAAIKSRTAASDAEARLSVDKEPTLVKDDNFMNRSLTKMLSKIAPEKKLDERCRDMVRELDTHERALGATSKRLTLMRMELITDVTKSMCELEELETQRLQVMKEGLSRYCLAAELIANQQHEIITNVLERTTKLDANDEAVALMKEIDRPSNIPSPGKRRTDGSDSEDEPDTGSELIVLFSKVEKLGEAMEYFRALVTRSTNALLEVSECEGNFGRTTQRVLDRHGYTRNSAAQWVYAADYSNIPMLAESTPMKSAPLSAAIGAVGATTMALTGNLRSAEFLSRFESPTTKIGWELVVCSVGNNSDLQLRSSEVSAEEVCQQLDLVTQRLEIGRKELMDKLSRNSKMVENAKLEIKKLNLKLTKCKATLRERRDTVKQVKEVIQSDSMDNADFVHSASAAAAAQDVASRDYIGSPESASVLDEPAPVTASSASDSSFMSQRKTSLFRKGGLKQVVGLETQADRVSRIEKQVSVLEDEERELTEALVVAEAALVSVTTVAKTEVLPVFDATREFLSTDLVTIKNAIECLMNWKSEALASSRNFNRHAKQAHDEIDVSKDVAAYIQAIQTAAKNIPKEQAAPVQQSLMSAGNAAVANALTGVPLTLLDIPDMEPFVAVTSELITQERALISSQAPATSLYSITNLAMTYASGADNGENSPPPHGFSPFKTRERKNTEDTLSVSSVVSNDLSPIAEGDESSSGKSQGAIVAEAAASAVAAAPPAAPPLDSNAQELLKFGLSVNDKVIESFSCALYPKKGLLTHGRMFITQHYLAFSGWPDTRVLLLIREISEVNRMNTLYYVPNALSVVMSDGAEYFFGSFIDREQCYAMLISLNDVGKHMASLPGYDQTAELRSLEFGYQTCNNLFGGADNPELALASSDVVVDGAVGNPLQTSETQRSTTPAKFSGASEVSLTSGPAEATPVRSSRAGSTSSQPNTPQVQTPLSAKVVTQPTSTPAAAAVSPPTPSAAASAAGASVATPSKPAAAAPVISTPAPQQTPQKVEHVHHVDENDGIKLNTLFERSNISMMQEKVLSFPSSKLWKTCWLHGKGYGGFLLEEGELEINYTEWVPCAATVPEDVAKLPYCYSRQFNYLHPRTTMLMFGPKNAPTMQTQYLYLPGGRKHAPDVASLATVLPARGVIMTLTCFQGIPMCDVFKVLQYWTFELNAADTTRTEMRVGLAIHYMKSSMFKAQIYGGSKEELTVQSLKWLNYAEKCCQTLADVLPAAYVEEQITIVEEGQPDSGDKGHVRRSSLKRVSIAGETAAPTVVAAGTAEAEVAAEEIPLTAPMAMSAVAPTTAPAVTAPSASAASKTEQLKPVTTQQASTVTTTATEAAPQALPLNHVVLILGCAVLVLMILLYRQSAHNSALVQQINLLSRKVEMSQTAMEISLRQSQSVVQKMESFINNIQK